MRDIIHTVATRVTSGLGNQMFQYACGVHAANVLGRDLFLDTSWFDYFQRHSVKRAFRLNRLRISCRSEYRRGLSRLLVGVIGFNNRWTRLAGQPLGRLLGLAISREKRPYQFQPGFPGPIDARSDLLLSGYWQTSDHFLALRERLAEEFQPAAPLSPGALAWMRKIESAGGYFLHVRRGDYANFSGGMLSPEYYRQATETISRVAGRKNSWFIFTEDVNWALENLRFLENAEVVDFPSADRDVEDMHLMSACRGGVIANSSFYWWGGALGKSQDRTIVCPKYWWGTPESDYLDLRIPEWIPIEVF